MQVLFGELSEAAYRDGVRMAEALAELLRAVARACSPTNHTKARTADCLEALDAFFPAKDSDARKALHKALRVHARKEVSAAAGDVRQAGGLFPAAMHEAATRVAGVAALSAAEGVLVGLACRRW